MAKARITQEVVEIIISPGEGAGTGANSRLTQAVVESVTQNESLARNTQEVVEVVTVEDSEGLVTQLVVEVLMPVL